MPDRHDEGADANLAVVGERRFCSVQARRVEQREILLRIARHHPGLGPRAVGALQRHVRLACDVRVGDDPARCPGDARAADVIIAQHGHGDPAELGGERAEIHHRDRGGRSPTVRGTSSRWPARSTEAVMR